MTKLESKVGELSIEKLTEYNERMKPFKTIFKKYKCTWSYGHYNVCPNCPPYKKYPEYGGQTIWECKEMVNFDAKGEINIEKDTLEEKN